MKLAQLSSAATTSLELTHPVTREKLGIVITGFTPDSREWRKVQKEVMNSSSKKMSMIVEKNQNRIELDSEMEEKKRVLLGRVVTDISGINDFKFSPEGVEDLFDNPQYSWMREQWADHLDDRSNFFAIPAKTAKRG